MKIKLAILDKDANYLNRIVSMFNNKYADRLVVYSFTDSETALNSLETEKIDVFIASEEFKIDTSRLPKKCGFVYFVEASSVESLYDQRTICKYQKADLIYKEILGIYAEVASATTGFKLDSNSSVSIITFLSAGGGVGSSTMAAACSLSLTRKGKKVLYLNLEQNGLSSSFFHGEGQLDLNDVIYTIKSKRSNLALKLESAVKQDDTGVSFYESPKVALDMVGLSEEDIRRLLTELKLTASYDYIIVDTDFIYDKKCYEIMNASNLIIFVSDGSEIANSKLNRTMEALNIIEQGNNLNVLSRTVLLYNKFSSKTAKTDNIDLKVLGGAPRFEGATTRQLMEQLASMSFFDTLI